MLRINNYKSRNQKQITNNKSQMTNKFQIPITQCSRRWATAVLNLKFGLWYLFDISYLGFGIFILHLFLCGLCVLCGETKAETVLPPAPESIRQIISASNLEWEKFETETLMLRMQFELSGRLLNDRDKTFFCELAANARNQLDQYVNQQQALLEQIDKYEGPDWEQKYGSTGLWRQLAAAVEATGLNRDQTDYLHSIICEDSQPSDLAREQLFKRKLRSDLGLCDALKVSMEQIKLFGLSEPNDLNNIAHSLYESECKQDKEMLLSLAILQRKFAPDRLRKTLSRFHQAAILLGKLLLAELSNRFSQSPPDFNSESISPVDAELAATAALQTDLSLYADLITTLAQSDRFQTPAVLYAAAMSFQDSRPQKTVELLIKASNLQLQRRNELLTITPEQIAQRAFELGYQEFTENPDDCQPAINAFENYSRIAPDKIDEQTQYLYATLLCNCNKITEAIETFGQLANQSQSLLRDAATLELLKIELNETAAPAVITRLHDFILGCTRPEEREIQIRRESMNLYCQFLLDRDGNDAAEKVLEILGAAQPTPGLPYELYKAQAFQQLGRLEESAHFLARAIDTNDNSLASQDVSLLSEILDKIELWQQNARDFNEMLENCARLAQFANEPINNREIALIFAEISILQGKRDQPALSEVEGVHFPPADEKDVSWLRPKARLLMAQGDFEQSARLWTKIAEIRRNDAVEQNQRSWGWWQAKFYELDCLATIPHPDKQNIIHTIEVLHNTYSNIPLPWAEKFGRLKEQLRDNTN